MASPAIRRMLERAEELKVFPAVAAQIQAVADDPNSSLTELEQVVAMDPALSANVLRIANSPFYGLNRTVGDLRQALFVMGFWATRNMALALTMMSPGKSDGDGRKRIWENALRVSTAARIVAEGLGLADGQIAFVSGMLHDIGRMVMLEVGTSDYQQLLEQHAGDDAAILEAERALFSFDHAELGGACLERWNLPAGIVLAVAYHHSYAALPQEIVEEERINAAVLSLANELTHTCREDGAPEVLGEQLVGLPANVQLGFAATRLDELAAAVIAAWGREDWSALAG
jgi:putative nucleotidyltransferase with HDIG domain